jgi:hypothetical protein
MRTNLITDAASIYQNIEQARATLRRYAPGVSSRRLDGGSRSSAAPDDQMFRKTKPDQFERQSRDLERRLAALQHDAAELAKIVSAVVDTAPAEVLTSIQFCEALGAHSYRVLADRNVAGRRVCRAVYSFHRRHGRFPDPDECSAIEQAQRS